MSSFIKSKYFGFLPILFTGLLFCACGDSSSGSNDQESSSSSTAGQNNTSELDVALEYFATEEDLPNCTDNRDGMAVIVAKEKLICVNKKWTPLDGIVPLVCKTPACNDYREGEYYFIASDSSYVQCEDGKWIDSYDNEIDEDTYLSCIKSEIVAGTAESEDDLPNCTDKREGEFFLVDDEVQVCLSSWKVVETFVKSYDDLPECDSENQKDLIYVIDEEKLVKCKVKASEEAPSDEIKSSSSRARSSSSAKLSSSSVRSSSSAKLSSSSMINSSSSAVSSTSTTGCTKNKVSPLSTWGYFGVAMPIIVSEGSIQTIYISVSSNELINQAEKITQYGVVIGRHEDRLFVNGSEIYSTSIYTLNSSYGYANISTNGYKAISFRKTGTWLEDEIAGTQIEVALAFYTPQLLREDLAEINQWSPIEYDLFAIPAGSEVCYDLTGDAYRAQ